MTVDGAEPLIFLPVFFPNLYINSGPGSDQINVAGDLPATLKNIAVVGGGTTAGDTLTVNGTTAADSIDYTPNTPAAFPVVPNPFFPPFPPPFLVPAIVAGPGDGNVTVGPVGGAVTTTVSFAGIEGLAINGQGGGDELTVTGPAGSQVTLTPGSTVDSGTVSTTTGGAAPVSFTPLAFSNLGARRRCRPSPESAAP